MGKRAFCVYVQILCSLISLITMMSLTFTGAKTLSDQNDEIVVTVGAEVPTVPDITPSQFKFETNYVLSRWYFNKLNGSCALNISEGILNWTCGGSSVSNIELFDNLENHFDPVVRDGTISNPNALVTIPPLFDYKLSMSFNLDPDVTFDSGDTTYTLHFDMQSPRPANLEVRFPSNYTFLESDVRSVNGCEPIFGQDDAFSTVNYVLQENIPYNFYLRFQPFCIQGKTTSIMVTLDISTVFPIKGTIRGTIKEVLEIPVQIDIWKINPIISVPILFPEYSQNIVVEKVCDGVGICAEITKPIEKLDNNSMGHYYVDYSGRQAIIYPRYDITDNFFDYTIEATFLTPPEYKPFQMEAIRPQALPFRYESYFFIDKIEEPPNWKLEITGNVEVKFILPSGVKLLPSESGNPTIDVQDGRPIARFVYNSPITLSAARWHVVYDIVSLEILFWLQVASILALILILVVSVLLHLQSARAILSLIGTPASLLSSSFYYLLITGGMSDPRFVYLFAGESVLFLCIFGVSYRKFRITSHRAQCPECNAKGMHVSSKLTPKHFIREYKCRKCGKIFFWRRIWQSEQSQYMTCKSCGNTLTSVSEIQTGSYRNEASNTIKVQIKCPTCGQFDWTHVRTD